MQVDFSYLFFPFIRYDCMRDAWMEGPPLSIPRRNCGAAQLNGKIYAIGGFDGTSLLNYVECYDPRMKSWMEVSPLLCQRSSASCTVHDGKIFVMGGTSGTRLKTVEYFDEKMNRWNSFDVSISPARRRCYTFFIIFFLVLCIYMLGFR